MRRDMFTHISSAWAQVSQMARRQGNTSVRARILVGQGNTSVHARILVGQPYIWLPWILSVTVIGVA